jgi:hypothetical protein
LQAAATGNVFARRDIRVCRELRSVIAVGVFLPGLLVVAAVVFQGTSVVSPKRTGKHGGH